MLFERPDSDTAIAPKIFLSCLKKCVSGEPRMRIVDIRERSIAISRYADRAGKPVVGYGFSSVGRFAQGG